MSDYNFVTARVATGAAVNTAEDVADLVAKGITHVIDCRSEFDDAPLFAQNKNISYLYNGTDDDGGVKPPEWFDKSIQFALDALTHHSTKVYAHCAAGINRGPSTAYAILRAVGFTTEGAEQAIRAARPQVGLRYKNDADNAIKTLGYE